MSEKANLSNQAAPPKHRAKGDLDQRDTQQAATNQPKAKGQRRKEIGGPKGLEPTRYGDWEAKGRCYDF